MSHNHLNINERCCIYNFINSGMSIREIAKALQRSPSTISRELRNNSHRISHLYYPEAAERKYKQRRLKCHRQKINDRDVIEYIKDKLQCRWSPEQISNYPSNIKVPSTATIYRIIHSKKIKNISMSNLRRKGKFQRPAETRGKFNDGGRTIKKRPKYVYKRQEIGHWEGDTVESGRIDRNQKILCLDQMLLF